MMCVFQVNSVCGQGTRPDSGVWFEGRPIKRHLFRREVAGNDTAASEWDIHSEALLPKHGQTISVKHSSSSQKPQCHLKSGYIEFKYYADAIHSGLTPPG